MLYKSFPLKLKELTLSDKRDRTINGWLIQTKTFYAIAIKDDDLVSKMSSRYGVTREKLEETLNKILRIEIAKEKSKLAKEKKEVEEDEEAEAEDDEKTDNAANDVPTTPPVAVESAVIKTNAAAKKKSGSKKRKKRK